MSRWQCPRCETMHYLTGEDNGVEGYFVTDRRYGSGGIDALGDWLFEQSERTNEVRSGFLCSECGYCQVEEPQHGER